MSPHFCPSPKLPPQTVLRTATYSGRFRRSSALLHFTLNHSPILLPLVDFDHERTLLFGHGLHYCKVQLVVSASWGNRGNWNSMGYIIARCNRVGPIFGIGGAIGGTCLALWKLEDEASCRTSAKPCNTLNLARSALPLKIGKIIKRYLAMGSKIPCGSKTLLWTAPVSRPQRPETRLRRMPQRQGQQRGAILTWE